MHLSVINFVSYNSKNMKLLLDKHYVVELRGLEPLTSSVRLMRSPN